MKHKKIIVLSVLILAILAINVQLKNIITQSTSDVKDSKTVVKGTGTALPSDKAIEPTPLPLELHDWKTYINTQYNFTLKHPTEWNIQNQKSEQVTFTVPNKPCSKAPCIQNGPVTINVFPNMKDTQLDTFAQEKVKRDFPKVSLFSDPYLKLGNELKSDFSSSISKDSIISLVYPGTCGGNLFYIKHKDAILEFKFDCNSDVKDVISTLELK